MEQDNYSVGLDIGTTKIVAIIGKENEYGKIEVLGIGRSKSLGVHRGVVNNITQTIKSIQQAVEQAEANSGLKIGSVVVGIAGQHIRSLQHSDYITRANSEEVINEDDLEKLCNQVYKLVMLPGEEIIHVLPQEYKVDGQAEIKQPIGMYGGRLEANFHVVVGQVSSIKNIGRCIKSAGLDLYNITLEPLASSEAVLSQEEKEAGVALIDIGGGTTDLAIFKDGIISITFSSDAFGTFIIIYFDFLALREESIRPSNLSKSSFIKGSCSIFLLFIRTACEFNTLNDFFNLFSFSVFPVETRSQIRSATPSDGAISTEPLNSIILACIFSLIK